MVKKVLLLLTYFLPVNTAHAHCDIPCGIYDPHLAQLAAHTVIRMTNMLLDLEKEANEKKFIHQLSRLMKVKEEHAELVKHEVRVIWGDYFKPEHLKDHPNLHELVFTIMKLASKTKQEINIDAANELLGKVQEFAEIFWETKGRNSTRVASPYPTGGEIVVLT